MSWHGHVFSIDMPSWVSDQVSEHGTTYPTVAARMQLAIELARRNVAEGTGGPFGAAIFETGTGRLVAPGLNLVVPARAAIAHAEIVAIAIAGQVTGTHDLGAADMPEMEMVTSTEPCAMCFGSVHWSGVRRLVCGAREQDARDVGFDEGTKPADWVSSLEERQIEVVRDVHRDAAVDVLRQYVAMGGLVYNGRNVGD